MHDAQFQWSIFDQAGNFNSSILVAPTPKPSTEAGVPPSPTKPPRLPSLASNRPDTPLSGDIAGDTSATNLLSQASALCCGLRCGAGSGQRKRREKENWVANLLPTLELSDTEGRPLGSDASEATVTVTTNGLTKAGIVDLDAITSNLGVYELPLSSSLWGEVFRYISSAGAESAERCEDASTALPNKLDGAKPDGKGLALDINAPFSLLERLWSSASAAAAAPEGVKAVSNGTAKESKARTIFSLLQPRRLLPPQLPAHVGRKTLLLDLDETLIHSFFSKVEGADAQFYIEIFGQMTDVSVLKRPGTDEFLEAVAEKYEVVIFTASIPNYANAIIDWLDPSGKLIHHRLYRDSCTWWRGGYVKDLAMVGRDLSNTILVDNSPHSFAFQTKNGVCVTSFIDETDDEELMMLTGPLLKLADEAGDVRDWLWTCYAEEQ